MTFEIESAIEIPERGHRGGRMRTYPFGDMQIGDSFSFPASIRKRVSVASVTFGNRYGMKFCTRVNGESGRVWRIA